jgi:hypothetical protein
MCARSKCVDVVCVVCLNLLLLLVGILLYLLMITVEADVCYLLYSWRKNVLHLTLLHT